MRFTLLAPALFLVCLTSSAQTARPTKPVPPPPPGPSTPSSAPATAPATASPAATSPSATTPANQPAAVTDTTGLAQPVNPKNYKVGFGDVLIVKVWREPELSGGKIVRPDGQINMGMIGDIQVQGLTPEKIQQDIASKLKDFILDPQISVEVQEVRSKKFYILGAVGKTGEYRLTEPITVLEALANAGGFHEFAKTSKIRILRGGKTLTFNYKQAIKNKHLEQNIVIEDGDKIVVPE